MASKKNISNVSEYDVFFDDGGFACVEYFDDCPTYLSIMTCHMYYEATLYEAYTPEGSFWFWMDRFGTRTRDDERTEVILPSAILSCYPRKIRLVVT